MKTIEERADAYCQSQGLFRGACASQISYGASCTYDGYMAGATEQKAIDDKECETMVGAAVKEAWEVFIDKAYDWLCQHFNDIDNPDFYSKRNHPTDIQSMYHWTVGEMVADFRKDMEAHFANAGKIEHSTLTWQEVARIVLIADEVLDEHDEEGWAKKGPEAYYTEVLTRYNNEKK